MTDQPNGKPSFDQRTALGLCGGCRFSRVQRSERGSEFWRCQRADEDEAFLRYPPLPVTACAGFTPCDPPNGDAKV